MDDNHDDVKLPPVLRIIDGGRAEWPATYAGSMSMALAVDHKPGEAIRQMELAVQQWQRAYWLAMGAWVGAWGAMLGLAQDMAPQNTMVTATARLRLVE